MSRFILTQTDSELETQLMPSRPSLSASGAQAGAIPSRSNRREIVQRNHATSIVCGVAVALASVAFTALPASAQFITVHGGPTYTPGVGGFKVGAFGPFDGLYGAGSSNKYDAAGTQQGSRPFRVHWDGASAQMQVTELDILGTDASGVASSGASGVDSAGNVVGNSAKYDAAGVYKGHRAVRWNASGTAATELGHLGTDALGVTASAPFAINSAGVAVGYAYKYDAAGVSRGQRAVRWEPSGTAATELGNLGTDALGLTLSYALAINSAGVAVGLAEKYDAAGVSKGYRAVRWEPSDTAATELEILSTDTQVGVSAINSAGVAIGSAGVYDLTWARALRWDASGAATELEPPPFLGTEWSEAVAINDAGMVVGRVNNFDGWFSVRWDASGIATELLDLGRRGGALVADINNAGIAVGSAYDEPRPRAAYWSLDGAAVDLNTLIDPTSGWTLTDARFISDTGWITGLGYFDADGPGGQAAYERPFFMQVPELCAGLPGDFNNDGAVDAADYVYWRKNFSSDQVMYNAWRGNFGASLKSGSGAAGYPLGASAAPLSAAVPEPATLTLFIIATALGSRRHREPATVALIFGRLLI
jgi:hypothetical protein